MTVRTRMESSPMQPAPPPGTRPPLVSIVCINHNYAQYLADAIDSALVQTYPHVEVIVVDDGSTDGSRDVMAFYGSRIVSVLKPSGGWASARNAGYAASRGELVCFLDSDDAFSRCKVAEVAEAFREHPDAGWYFHPVRVVDAPDGTLPPDASGPCGGAAGLARRDLRAEIARGVYRWTAPPTSGLCFRRSLLERIMPMPEEPGVGLADNYVKYAAVSLAEGVVSERELALQRLHGENAYTGRAGKQRLTARKHVLNAYWLRERFPHLERFADRLYARGLGLYRRTGGVEPAQRETVRRYWAAVPLRARPGIGARAAYHRVRGAG